MGWFSSPKTPDDVIASEVREAALQLNEAIRKAKNAGLYVSLRSRYPGGVNSEWLGMRYIEVDRIERTKKETF